LKRGSYPSVFNRKKRGNRSLKKKRDGRDGLPGELFGKDHFVNLARGERETRLWRRQRNVRGRRGGRKENLFQWGGRKNGETRPGKVFSHFEKENFRRGDPG